MSVRGGPLGRRLLSTPASIDPTPLHRTVATVYRFDITNRSCAVRLPTAPDHRETSPLPEQPESGDRPGRSGDHRGRGQAGVLDLALLGLLADGPMHGYQLRVRLTEILGPVRSYSYGSLYPALRRLEQAGLLRERSPLTDPDEVPLAPRRTRVTYAITARGKERLADLLTDAGPQSWTDEGFGVHLALFPRTAVQTRLRILDGRRRRLEQRREGLRAALSRATQRVDDYTAQLHRLAIQAHDREVLWLGDLIAREGQRPEDPDRH